MNQAKNSTILVALDPSSDHDRSEFFDMIETEAETHDARLVFLSVVPELFMSTATDQGGLIASMKSHAQHQQSSILDARWPELGADRRLVRYGPVAGEIIDTAAEIGANLIIIHARRPGVASYALGSVASRVVNHARASVLVVRVTEDMA